MAKIAYTPEELAQLLDAARAEGVAQGLIQAAKDIRSVTSKTPKAPKTRKTPKASKTPKKPKSVKRGSPAKKPKSVKRAASAKTPKTPKTPSPVAQDDSPSVESVKDCLQRLADAAFNDEDGCMDGVVTSILSVEDAALMMAWLESQPRSAYSIIATDLLKDMLWEYGLGDDVKNAEADALRDLATRGNSVVRSICADINATL
jgi:hypothetical protein